MAQLVFPFSVEIGWLLDDATRSSAAARHIVLKLDSFAVDFFTPLFPSIAVAGAVHSEWPNWCCSFCFPGYYPPPWSLQCQCCGRDEEEVKEEEVVAAQWHHHLIFRGRR